MKLSSFTILTLAATGTSSLTLQPKDLAGPVLSIILFQSVPASGYVLPDYGRFPVNPIRKKRHEGGKHGLDQDDISEQRGPARSRNGTVSDGDRNRKSQPGPPLNATVPSRPERPPAPPTPGVNGTAQNPNDLNQARNLTGPPPPPAPPAGVNGTALDPNTDPTRNSTSPPPPPAPPITPPFGLNSTGPGIGAGNSTSPPAPPAGSNSTGPGTLPPNFPPPPPTDAGFVPGGFRDAATKREQFRYVRGKAKRYSA